MFFLKGLVRRIPSISVVLIEKKKQNACKLATIMNILFCFSVEIFFDSHQRISYVNEDAALGTVITRVRAKPNKRIRLRIAYSIVAENLKSITDHPTFKIDRMNGDIKVNAPLDREKTSEYLLEIEAKYLNATNGKETTKARSFIIVRVSDINDNAPRFSHPSYTITVPCNVKPGSVLYRMDTYDPDDAENAQVTYRLEPTNPFFTVQKHSGKVKVLRGLRKFCNESSQNALRRFEYKVVATDRGSPSLRSRVTVRFIIAAIDLSSQTMFVWYSESSDLKFVQKKKKPSHKVKDTSRGKRALRWD